MIASKFTITAKGDKKAEITIFGDIGYQYSFEQFHEELSALGEGREITVRINSDGGDVFTGFAIYNRLKRYKGKIITYVEGLAASMGSIIFMAGDERVMPENAMLMIHNPAGASAGNADELASFADALRAMEDNLVKAYVDGSDLDEKKIRALMTKETWLTAAQAIDKGFATRVDAPVKMAAHAGFDLSRYKNVPHSWGAATQTQTQEDADMADKTRDDEIKRICALVGKSNLADSFIKDEKSVGDVLAALDGIAKDEKAKADAKAKAEQDAANAGKTEGKAVSEADVRAKLVEESKEITSLCSLAGMADKAADFIIAGKTVGEVIVALDTAKKAAAEASKGKQQQPQREISNHSNARSDADAGKVIDTGKIWDKFNGRKKSA